MWRFLLPPHQHESRSFVRISNYTGVHWTKPSFTFRCAFQLLEACYIHPYQNTHGSCEHFGAFYPFAGLSIYYFPSVVVGLRSVNHPVWWNYIYNYFLYRVYALYQKNLPLGIFLALYLIAEFGVNLWVYGTPGEHREHYSDVNFFPRCLTIG